MIELSLDDEPEKSADKSHTAAGNPEDAGNLIIDESVGNEDQKEKVEFSL